MRLPVFARKPIESLPPREDAPRLVVLTEDESFYARLQTIAETCKWRITRARSFEDVRRQMAMAPSPIVVYERDWDRGDWRTGLSTLHHMDGNPCVLLASRVADEYLWQEVVRNHGYDILPKTAHDEKLIRVLRFAWFWVRSRELPGAGRR